MTQAQHQYGLNGSISTATMAQYLIKSEAYHESRQSLTTTMSNVLQPQENGYDRIATEVRDDSQLHRQYNQQYLPTPKSGVPLPTPKSDVPLPTTEPDVPLPTIEPDIYLPTPKPEVNHPTTSQGSPLPTKLDDTQQQDPPLGLGIIIPNDTKQKQNHAETSYFNDWFFQLTEWSTVFEDSDGPDDGKEL